MGAGTPLQRRYLKSNTEISQKGRSLSRKEMNFVRSNIRNVLESVTTNTVLSIPPSPTTTKFQTDNTFCTGSTKKIVDRPYSIYWCEVKKDNRKKFISIHP